ncbi:hypothetical protein JCM19294_2513 [Nonlabens tegetincola]|uniref:DUF4177 domain-containing protein n=1 Tax=Nonlabens tegetincola TaxID=323273 RepID=A0A090QJL0_9FLAO|nr:hypothetical protein [Nonlabens tegetincola]GAK95731.1 hypothetical protein JCM19294_2513 [Nonlabens tegetincola]
MKNLFYLLGIFVFVTIIGATITTNESTTNAQPVYEFQIVTVVESIVPNGLGRSRMLVANSVRDYKEFTSTQTEDDNTRNKSKRKDIRVKDFDETKLLNFFNIGGIRFQNIAANDALVTSKLNDMSATGWVLESVNSATESYGGKGDSNGIYVTRYIFKKEVLN